MNKQANSVPMAPYTGRGEWACYALGAADRHVDIHERAHLWPNHNALGTRKILSAQRPDPSAYQSGLWVGWDLIGKWAAP